MKNNMFFLLILFITNYCLAQEYPSNLPEQIKSELKEQYSDWGMLNNTFVIKELNLDTTYCEPNLVRGNFNSDKIPDYALLIKKNNKDDKNEQLCIAFVSDNNIYKKYIIEKAEGDGYIADYIWLSPKGSNLYNFEIDKRFISQKDGIAFVFIEKAVSIYFFYNNKFISITNAD